MEFRQLGRSGLKVPVLSFGTATFGGGNDFFKAWGSTQVNEAIGMIDLCLDRGACLFDSADMYSDGLAEEILGKAIFGKRHRVLISTKASFRTGLSPNDLGSSRFHLTQALDRQLKRLKTDYIDLYQMHGFDPLTPVEEVLRTLETFIQSGKVRYIGCSNFSGWHLMKSLAMADHLRTERYVAHQVYYSLLGRDYEQELMPLGLDQGIGALVWSPLGWGRLTGKIKRGQILPELNRFEKTQHAGPPCTEAHLFRVLDALEAMSQETGKSIPQIAIQWLLHQPTVCSVILGARTQEQLRHNLEAVEWSLTSEQIETLDQVTRVIPSYPYWHQTWFHQDRYFSSFTQFENVSIKS